MTARTPMSIRCWLAALLLACGCAAAVAAAPQAFAPDGIPPRQFSSSQTDPDQPDVYFLGIFGGSTAGVYYYVASAICDALRARFDEHRIRCVPLRSQGVASNRALMNEGRAQMIIVQSDTNYFAASGEVPIHGARSVVSLHNELGVLVAGPRVELKQLADFARYRVNLASPESVAHKLWLEYLGTFGLAEADVPRASGFAQDINYDGICDDFIDIFGLWSGHPVLALEAAAERCGARVLGMWHEGVASLLASREYYFRGHLPAGVYPGQDQPLDSYGIKASLVAHEATLPYIVYWVTKVLIEDVARVRSGHQALKALLPEEMFREGNFLPFHEGAQRYWDERGWTLPAAGGSADAVVRHD